MRILLGVTGGIAAYKSAEIVRAFVKRGDDVRAVMTSGAQEFITPLTLQVLTNNTVGTEIFDPTYESEIGHIDLARWPDVILVAPATANAIARMAAGMADDLLTTVLCATTAPVVVAPAMNTQMWFHPLVQRNLDTLRDIGHRVIDPDQGELACKEVGPGRLPDPHVLLDEVDAAHAPKPLAGKRVLVSAGPTREAIDAARFLTNPSTGKMGYALARRARALGATVRLVSGPVELLQPYGVERVVVQTARDMRDAVMAVASEMDIIVKAAAVADWRPKVEAETKREKSSIDGAIALEPNPDILAELGVLYGVDSGGTKPFLVGFAAESHDVEERGKAKRERKGAHMLVANLIGGEQSSFASDDATVCIITPERAEWTERMPKADIAARVWDAIVAEMEGA
jgi:phosphopantothenoylcysteine decarboxylase/phosphopantothenate--cysteine ligase